MTDITTVKATNGKRQIYIAAYNSKDIKTIERMRQQLQRIVGEKWRVVK